MASTDTEYELDEFDVKAQEVHHRGVHRAKVTLWQRLLPFIVVFVVVAGLVGAGVAFSKLNDTGTKSPAPTAGETTTSAGTTAPSVVSSAPAPVPSATFAKPDVAVEVSVSNAGTVSGMAAKVQKALQDSGWSVPLVNSAAVTGVTETTVLYRDDAAKAQAESIAHRLGIKQVVLNDKIASAINVQILTEFGDTVPPEPTDAAPASSSANPSASASASPSATTATADPAVAIAVINGNGGAGVATTVANGLKGAGWSAAYANGNAPAAETTTVYYATDAQKATAEALAKVLGSSAVVAQDSQRTQLTVIVGADYKAPAQ